MMQFGIDFTKLFVELKELSSLTNVGDGYDGSTGGRRFAFE